MSKFIELTTRIVTAHASCTTLTTEDIVTEINQVHAALSALEQKEASGSLPVTGDQPASANEPAVNKRKAFGKDKIFCMICGKGFTTLKRHLKTAHDMTDKEYRETFDIPAGTPLAARNYSEARRQSAIEKGLAGNLQKARDAKKGKG